MSSRGARRRKERNERPIIGRLEMTAAAVVVAAAGITLGIVLLLGGGSDDDDGTTQPDPTGSAAVTSTPFEPVDADGQAIIDLGRRSVEALPQGQWPALYDAFTQEFRDRCPREEFVAAGDADAASLGDSLSQIQFKYLTDVNIEGDAADAVIVGALGGSEYTIGTYYERVNGVWQIAPPPGTSGCDGFNRLTG